MIHFGGNDCLKSAVIFLSIGWIDGGRTRIPPTWSWPPFSEASLMLSLVEFQFFVPFLFYFYFVTEIHALWSRCFKFGVEVAGRCSVVVWTVSGRVGREITAPLVRMASLCRLMFLLRFGARKCVPRSWESLCRWWPMKCTWGLSSMKALVVVCTCRYFRLACFVGYENFKYRALLLKFSRDRAPLLNLYL